MGEGDEVITSPFSFVASANVALYERARPVFADIDPVTLNLDPAAAAAVVTERTRALLPVHIFGYPADMPAFEVLAARHGLGIVEDACEALGAVHADGTPVGGRGNPAVFGFYANKQLTTGEGGMVAVGETAMKARIDSERNQGRAPDMGWLDHDRLGFNYRLSDIACAIGSPRWLAWGGCSRSVPASRASIAKRLSGSRILVCPARIAGGDRRGGSCSWSSYHTGWSATRSCALSPAGIQSKPYLPAIHLMSFYRERFGHREGEFPVCEDVAARSLALPFYPGLGEGDVERVALALRGALGR